MLSVAGPDVYTYSEYSPLLLTSKRETDVEETEKSLAQFRRWPFWLCDNGPRPRFSPPSLPPPVGTCYFRNRDRRRGITFVCCDRRGNFAINDFAEVSAVQRIAGRGIRSGVQPSRADEEKDAFRDTAFRLSARANFAPPFVATLARTKFPVVALHRC